MNANDMRHYTMDARKKLAERHKESILKFISDCAKNGVFSITFTPLHVSIFGIIAPDFDYQTDHKFLTNLGYKVSMLYGEITISWE